MRIKFYSNRGDTLIEVAIATAIIGFILFSAYTLSNQSFKLGRIARERTQATQIIQAQAEGLRFLRDSAPSWTAFTNSFTSPQSFHLRNNSSGGWTPVAGSGNPSAYDPEIPSFYTVTITRDSATTTRHEYTITVSWQRFGGGSTQETSTLYYHLTDRHISF